MQLSHEQQCRLDEVIQKNAITLENVVENFEYVMGGNYASEILKWQESMWRGPGTFADFPWLDDHMNFVVEQSIPVLAKINKLLMAVIGNLPKSLPPNVPDDDLREAFAMLPLFKHVQLVPVPASVEDYMENYDAIMHIPDAELKSMYPRMDPVVTFKDLQTRWKNIKSKMHPVEAKLRKHVKHPQTTTSLSLRSARKKQRDSST